MTKKLEIVELPIGEIIEYENNPRENEDAAAKVAQSIIEFGFVNPIAIDRNKVIIAGHSRLKAARKLGQETVPCIIHDVDEETARIARIAENRTQDFSTWDLGKLITGLRGINNATKNAFFAPAGGLPPWSIAAPGWASIHAVMHPEPSNYLLFVLKDLATGEHHFSTNLTDHNTATARYLD